MSEVNFQAGVQTPTPAAAPAVATTQPVGNPVEPPQVAPDDDKSFIEYNGQVFSKEDVLKKLSHADSHINTLVDERKADRERLDALEASVANASKVGDVLEALKGTPAAPATPAEPADKGAPVDANAIAETVLSQLSEREAVKRSEENWNSVTQSLTKAYGEKVNEKVKLVAIENDMTVEEAAAFARSKPKAFLKLFGNELAGSTTSTPLSPGKGARSPSDPNTGPVENSGYSQAHSTKDQVAIYQDQLRKAGLDI